MADLAVTTQMLRTGYEVEPGYGYDALRVKVIDDTFTAREIIKSINAVFGFSTTVPYQYDAFLPQSLYFPDSNKLVTLFNGERVLTLDTVTGAHSVQIVPAPDGFSIYNRAIIFPGPAGFVYLVHESQDGTTLATAWSFYRAAIGGDFTYLNSLPVDLSSTLGVVLGASTLFGQENAGVNDMAYACAPVLNCAGSIVTLPTTGARVVNFDLTTGLAVLPTPFANDVQWMDIYGAYTSGVAITKTDGTIVNMQSADVTPNNAGSNIFSFGTGPVIGGAGSAFAYNAATKNHSEISQANSLGIMQAVRSVTGGRFLKLMGHEPSNNSIVYGYSNYADLIADANSTRLDFYGYVVLEELPSGNLIYNRTFKLIGPSAPAADLPGGGVPPIAVVPGLVRFWSNYRLTDETA